MLSTKWFGENIKRVMNVLFLTLTDISNVSQRGIYTDLMREFRDRGHSVHIVSPRERRMKQRTSLTEVDGVKILGVKTLNIQKTHFVEKGVGTLLIEGQFKRAIKKYLKGVTFDLILYSTPPITFTGVVKMLKTKNPSAVSYLLLKDIFPQNAVDMEMFTKSSVFYKFFRRKEIELYKNSDYIGCMSPANVEFLLKHNDYIDASRVEVSPNSITPVAPFDESNRDEMRQRYELPCDKPIFIYGGNLGVPQAIDYLLECLKANANREDAFFLVVGSGTKFGLLKEWFDSSQPKNMKLLSKLPKEDYDRLVASCDVGLIFLDHRFTIPNYPSRLLSYLEYKMPIIAATDSNTDIGSIAQENGYGYWCESVRVDDFTSCVNEYVSTPHKIKEMGECGYEFLLRNYTTSANYEIIVRSVNGAL